VEGFALYPRHAERERAGLLAFTTTSHAAMRTRPRRAPKRGPAHCLGCLGPVPAGELVCGAACDELWFDICPTKSGRLYNPCQHSS
jgi:hypothetical protein